MLAVSVRSMHPAVRRALISAALGLASYYATRVCGGSQLEAMVVTTIVSAIRVAYAAIRSRSFDLVAGYTVVVHGLKLAVGLATLSPRAAMLAGHVGALTFVLFMVGSWALKRPLTEMVVEALRPGWVQQHVTRNRWTTHDHDAYHRLHLHLTLFAAMMRLVQLMAAIVIIIAYSPDVSQPLLVLLNIPVKIATAVVIVAAIGRFLRLRRRAAISPPI